MSGLHERAPSIDPLDALRAADHRPVHEVWRERSQSWLRESWRDMGRRGGTALLFIAVAIAIGWRLFLVSEPPIEDSLPIASRAEPPTSVVIAPAGSGTLPVASASNTEPPATVVVHVAGAVLRPGLVTGQTGWRVNDAVSSAGGALPAADLDRLNLAAPIADGQRIFVPLVGEAEPSVLTAGGAASAPGAVSGPVNLNTADSSALESLPGIGPATAATIINHRDEHGAFGDVDALVAVRGIGPATLDTLRDHVTVG